MSSRCHRAHCLSFAICLLVGCSQPSAGPTADSPRTSVTVAAPATLKPLLRELELSFERTFPAYDVILIDAGDSEPGEADLHATSDFRGWSDDSAIPQDEPQHRLANGEPWLENSLVLVTPRGSGLRLVDLAKGSCLIIIEFGTSTAALAELESRGIRGDLADRLIVHRTTADSPIDAVQQKGGLAFVFATTASQAGGTLTILARFDDRLIQHTLAASTKGGRALLRFLQSPEALAAARTHGFIVPTPDDAPSAPDSHNR